MRKCIRPLLDGPDDSESIDIVKCDCEWPVYLYRKAKVKKRK